MASVPSEFIAQIKALRATLRLSQEGLAKELGVSFATVNRWENGRTQPSTLAKKQLAQFIAQQKQQGMLNDE